MSMSDEEFAYLYMFYKSPAITGKTVTDKEICTKMKIPRSTYYRKKKKLAQRCNDVQKSVEVIDNDNQN